MKSVSITLLFLIQGCIALSQSGVWVTVHDQSILPSVNSNNSLHTENTEFQYIIDEFQIESCFQAFPDSRQENLQMVYEMRCDCDPEELIVTLTESSLPVSGVERGPEYELAYATNDYNLVFANDYALDLINAEGAWDISHGSQDIQLAITDSNYDLNHAELADKASYIQSPIYYPNYYHGTAVAVIAAGNTDNGIGKSSIGFDSGLQLYAMGYNNMLAASYNGAHVINVSWYSGCWYSSYIQDIIDEIHHNGTIIVAAAGNGGTCGGPNNYVYPAACDHVIAVTSIGPTDLHEKTPGDPNSTHQHNDRVDLCAPGYNVPLTVANGWYLTGNGSSFAAPFVTGTIGLMLAVNPCLTSEEVEYILKTTAHSIDALNPAYEGKLGAGRLDAAAAVEMASTYNTLDLTIDSGIGCGPQSGYGTALVLGNEGTEPYAYQWNTGQLTAELTDLSTGSYAVQVTDAKGCKGFVSVELETFENLAVAYQASMPICSGDENGIVSLQVTGGKADYSYQWSDGSTQAFRSDLGQGQYTVLITDELGCSVQKEIEMTEPEKMKVVIEVEGENSGASWIDLTVKGGVSDYEFFWSNGSTDEDIEVVDNGIYDVLITDANNCSVSTSVEVNSALAGIENDQIDFQVQTAPGAVNIPSVIGGTISLINAGGQVISIQENEFSIDGLSSGIYFLMIVQGTAQQTQQIFVP